MPRWFDRVAMGMAAALVACSGAERKLEEREDAWLERMTEIDARAIGIRDAIVRDDLSTARSEAKKLRDALPEKAPERLGAALDRLDRMTSARDGAAALADLSVGCLQCHAERNASLAMRETVPVRSTAGAIPAEMERHRVFVDGVWLGLIGGGAQGLHETVAFLDQGSLVAGTPVGRSPDFTLNPAAQAIDARVHDLAHQLRDAPADQRPPLFAELLSTCADCHRLSKVRDALTASVRSPSMPKMNDHFVDMVLLELAVVGGDIDAARAAATRLAEAGIEAPPAAEPHVRALKEAADATKRMNELPALAQGTADLLAICGRCHAATTGGPKAAVEPAPGPDAPEMARHLYGSFWMGQSLLANDDLAWTRGAEVLAASGLAVKADPALDETVHEIGRRASTATDPTDRARIYGDLLSTCSPCHKQLPR